MRCSQRLHAEEHLAEINRIPPDAAFANPAGRYRDACEKARGSKRFPGLSCFLQRAPPVSGNSATYSMQPTIRLTSPKETVSPGMQKALLIGIPFTRVQFEEPRSST